MSTSKPGSNRSRIFKILISVFLLYHLSAVIILPNGSSIIGRKLAWLFLPYANPLLFNRTWQFFSPGPMKAFYLEYDVEKNEVDTETFADDGSSTRDEPFVYPSVHSYNKLDDYFLRMLAGMQFIAVQPTQFEKYFVPYLCRKHPNARALDIRSVLEEIPPIDTARDDQTFSEMSKSVKLPRRSYDCVPNIDEGVSADQDNGGDT